MIRNIGPHPFADILPVGPDALESYEDWQIQAEFKRALRRSILRTFLTRLIDSLCLAYGALGLGALRRGSAARDDALAARPGHALVDDVAGSIVRQGALVDRLPRLRSGDLDAWMATYRHARDSGVGRIPGRFGKGGFYVSCAPAAVVRLELARTLGIGSFATATPPTAIAVRGRCPKPGAAAECRAGTGLA